MAYNDGYSGGYAGSSGDLGTASSAGSSTVAAGVAVALPLAGTASGTSTVSATAGELVSLSAATGGWSNASATVGPSIGLAGQSDGRTVIGYTDLTQYVTWLLEGRSAGKAGVQGAVGVNWALEGRAVARSTATATAVPDPTFTFIPPLAYDRLSVFPSTTGPTRRLFRYYGGDPRGLSVVKVAGHYTTMDGPYADFLTGVEGTDYFLGGHVYTVTKAVSAALAADGYSTS